jgi:hypothetical protein
MRNVLLRAGQRQRRRSRDDSFGRSKKEILRERVVSDYNFSHALARMEVKKPLVSSGSFGYFSSCWEK